MPLGPEYAERVKLPVTLVCGLQSAGKTALIDHVLRNSGGRQIGVLQTGAEPVERVIEHADRCAATGKYQYLLIELQHGRDPEPFVSALSERAAAEGAAPVAVLDTVIAIVDAMTLVSDFCSYDLLEDRGFDGGRDGPQSVADAVTNQVESADLIALNKADCALDIEKEPLFSLLRALNASAAILECVFGSVAVDHAVGAGRLHGNRLHGSASWIVALAGRFPSHESQGVSSFVYRKRRPFHPQRLQNFLADPWPGVVRTRGYFWLATRMDWVGELSQAGTARRNRGVSVWWASLLEGRACDLTQMEELLGLSWDPVFGDRRQELAFVGLDMDEAALRARLDACLLTDDEMAWGPQEWLKIPDPFPPWGSEPMPHRLSITH
jgi:G3E family GTPase